MTGSSLRIVPVRTMQEAEDIRGDWDRILSGSPNASIFQSYEWAMSWWHRFGTRNRQLLILVARNEHAVVAIAPLVLTVHRLRGILPWRTVEFLGAETVNGDHLDILAASGVDRTALASLICTHMRSPGAAWDLVRLDSVPSASVTIGALAKAAQEAGFDVSSQPLFECPAATLPTSYEKIGSMVREGLHREIEQKTRRLTRQFDWCTNVCSPKEVPDGLAILFDLHARRWHSRGISGAFTDTAKREFYLDVCGAFARRGWLRLHIMRVNGAPAAALLCFKFGETYTSMQNGFDPQWSKFSVGQILLTKVVEQAVAERCTTLDFLRGPEPYKYDWGAVNRSTMRIEVRRRTLANRILRLAAAIRGSSTANTEARA